LAWKILILVADKIGRRRIIALSGKKLSEKWILNFQAVNFLAVLKILSVQNSTFSFDRAGDDHGVVPLQMETVKKSESPQVKG